MPGRRLIFTFGALGAFLAAGYGVMFTMLDDFRDVYGIPARHIGIVVAMGFFSQFVAMVFLGPVADRGFAKRMVVVGITIDIVGLIGMAVSHHLWSLVLSRLIMGLGAGMVMPAARRIVILTDKENLGRNLGYLMSADIFGFALGPAISAVLRGPFGIPAPFLVIAVVTALFVPMVLRVRVNEGVEVAGERLAFDLLKHKPFVAILLMGCALFVMIGTFDAVWVLALDDMLAPEWIKNMGIVLFAVPLVIFGSVSGKLAQKVGPFRLGTLGLSAGAGFMSLYGQMPTAMGMFVLAMAHSMSDAFTATASGVGVGMTAPPGRQAAAQGLIGGVQTLVAGVVAILAGALYDGLGRAWVYGLTATLMLVLVTASAVLAVQGKAWNVRG